MDVSQIRRLNLKALIKKFALGKQRGGVKSFAVAAGLPSPSHVSQMQTEKRPITDNTARKIEVGLGLPRGWMDHVHSNNGVRSNPDYVPFIPWDKIKHWPEIISENLDKKPVIQGLSDESFAIQSREESMTGKSTAAINIGSLVYIDPIVKPTPGEDNVLALVKGEPTIRQLKREGGQLVLVPVDARFDTLVIDSDMMIIGTVMCWLKSRVGDYKLT